MQHLMCELIGVQLVNHPGHYLVMPTLWRKSKKEALIYIKDRTSRKVDDWKLNFLSLASKEILIEYVAMTIPVYPMSCFKFLASIFNETNSALGNFWWGKNNIGSKMQVGGMGLRDLSSFNWSLLTKQCCRLPCRNLILSGLEFWKLDTFLIVIMSLLEKVIVPHKAELVSLKLEISRSLDQGGRLKMGNLSMLGRTIRSHLHMWEPFPPPLLSHHMLLILLITWLIESLKQWFMDMFLLALAPHQKTLKPSKQ